MTGPDPEILAVASHIGERFVRSAITSDGMSTWMGDDLEGTSDAPVLVHRAFGGTLYDGTAGIGRFLADLATVTGDVSHRNAACEAFRHALHHAAVDDLGDGLFDGRLGIAVSVLSRCNALGDAQLAAAATTLAADIADRAEVGERHDYVGGLAGGVAGFVALEDLLGGGTYLAAARTLAAPLVASAKMLPTGAVWAHPDDAQWGQRIPVNGLAHGGSGVAHALIELERIDPGGGVGDHSCLDIGREALRWEQQWFLRQRNGWRDLRGQDHQSVLGAEVTDHWCQGTAGAGLARLRAAELLGDDRLCADASAAVQRAVIVAEQMCRTDPAGPQPFAANASLCHGWGGLSELLCEAARVFANPDLLDTARRLGAHGERSARSRGKRWSCGLLGAKETPGLLVGLAGIGTTYLRLLGDARVAPAGLPTIVV